MKRNVIIVDVDHVLANAAWRDYMLTMIGSGEHTWDEYHAAGEIDEPIFDTRDIINALSAAGFEIIAVTGRNEKFRSMTLGWFAKHQISIDELIMRPDRNYERTGPLKVAAVRERFGDDVGIRANVAAVLDDREEVTEEFLAIGVTVMKVSGRVL